MKNERSIIRKENGYWIDTGIFIRFIPGTKPLSEERLQEVLKELEQSPRETAMQFAKRIEKKLRAIVQPYSKRSNKPTRVPYTKPNYRKQPAELVVFFVEVDAPEIVHDAAKALSFCDQLRKAIDQNDMDKAVSVAHLLGSLDCAMRVRRFERDVKGRQNQTAALRNSNLIKQSAEYQLAQKKERKRLAKQAMAESRANHSNAELSVIKKQAAKELKKSVRTLERWLAG